MAVHVCFFTDKIASLQPVKHDVQQCRVRTQYNIRTDIQFNKQI